MSEAAWFDGFEARDFRLGEVTIHARSGGRRDGAPLLLLHGFPQTHAIWERVAQRLADRFFLVMPDLRGYGDSSKLAGTADHTQASKRAMAADMLALMHALGHESFGLVGHDRGGRVAHRLALDHPQAVSRMAVLDIAPTLDMYAATDMAFASAYYHWFHLIQPAPLPERMIGGDALGYLHAKLGRWGAGATRPMQARAVAEYERCWCLPPQQPGGLLPTVHAACEDYRASAGIDLEHDRASRAEGRKIACDLLVLWGERGVVHRMFKPLALWQAQCAGQVSGRAVPAGHFIPEELPEDTADALGAFFAVPG
jgi:haloacetate dehalogenase